MKIKLFLFSLIAGISLSVNAADIRYTGGDISLLPTYEAAKVVYKDINGNEVSFLPYCKEVGMNAMRVRLFVDPDKFNATYAQAKDDNVCQDLEYILPLCKAIVDNGFRLMLDFHYSDTWADPVKQWTPEAWKSLNDDELVDKIYEYTKDVLETLKENGIVPAFIQPGNEISYGMMWCGYTRSSNIPNKCYSGSDDNWDRFGRLLKSAISACNEVCPNAKIVLHTERINNQGIMTNFYSQMKKLGVEYDIIGLSYYPYYHGPLSSLESALNKMEAQEPDKDIMIVEAGYPLYWTFSDATYGESLEFGYGDAEKQNNYTKALVELLLKHEKVNGLFWWWMEYNPYISNSNKLSNWYNSAVIDPNTGKVTPAFATIASYGTELPSLEPIEPDEGESGGTTGVTTITEGNATDDYWYDLNGRKTTVPTRPGLYIHQGKKIMVK